MTTYHDGSSTDAPHVYRKGTRLSSVYTLGRDGKPCPSYAAEPTSSGFQAWKRGHAEWLRARPEAPAMTTTPTAKTPHSPGPWRHVEAYQPESNRHGSTVFAPYIVDATGRHVAAAMLGIDDLAEVAANIRLIAAAPAMRKLLANLIGTADNPSAHTLYLVQACALLASLEETP